MSESIDAIIGSKVRELRDRASILQSDAARACDLSLSDYRSSEAGIRRFSTRELFQLSGELNASLADIFKGLQRDG
jgi:transcriptional regulator with XRE-family HTH domain